MRSPVVLVALLAWSAPALAEVEHADESGFATHHSVTVPETAEQVWAALGEPARWWDPAHSWSGDAASLTLDLRAGGCFCESLGPNGGGAEHMRVIHVRPRSLLRMRGALGPLQEQAASGVLSISLREEGQGTRIDWRYAVGGYTRPSLRILAPAVDAVMGQQLSRLQAVLGSRPGQ